MSCAGQRTFIGKVLLLARFCTSQRMLVTHCEQADVKPNHLLAKFIVALLLSCFCVIEPLPHSLQNIYCTLNI